MNRSSHWLLQILVAITDLANVCLIKLLADNETDGEAFLLLSNEEVKDLVKLVGPRTKLMKKRCQLLKQEAPVIESSTSAPRVSCIIVGYGYLDILPIYLNNKCLRLWIFWGAK